MIERSADRTLFRHSRFTNLAIVVFNAVLIGLLWWSVLDRVQVERDDTVRAAVTRNNNLAIAFEHYTIRVIENAERTLRDLIREEARSGQGLDLRQFVEDHRLGNESLVGVTMANEHGDARFAAFSAPTVSRTNLGDRAHFQALRTRDPGKVFIGQPLFGRLTGKTIIPITQRISKPGGSFGGMAMVSMEPSMFSDFLRSADLGPQEVISVTGLDGVTRARLKGSIASSGEDINGGQLFAQVAKGQRSGNYLGLGTLDGVSRYFSYRVEPRYGLVIAVGTPEAGVMAATNERRTRYFWATGATSVVLAAFAMMMMIALASRKRSAAATSRLAAIVESSDDAIIGMEFSGIVTSWNAGAQRLFGFAAAEMIGQPLLRIIPPDRQDEEAKFLVQIARGETVRQVETVRLCKDGSPIDVSATVSPIRDAAGKIVAVSMLARDITERKRAEAALRESESEFRALAESMPQIVWMTRPDGWNIFFNQRWVDYTGLTLAESLGHGWNKPFHPQDQQRAWDAWQAATVTVGTYMLECRLRRADGEYRWWLLRAVPQRDAAGILVKWVGTCTDIHDLKLAELEISRVNRELQQQQTELRVLFDLMPALIMFKDTDNRILRINQRGADAEGLRVDEIEGRSALDIYPVHGAEGHLADLEVVRSGQPQLGVIQQIRTRLGKEMWVQRDRVPYRDETGKVIGIVLMAQDVTERKRDQDALRELNADLEERVRQRTAEVTSARSQAEEASRAKSEFLAAMSHEIRTPMSGMLGLLELLELSTLDEEQHSTLGLARDSGTSLLSIIDDILDFSKIEAERLDLHLVASSVRGIVENACRLHSQVASSKNLVLRVDVSPEISPLLAVDPLRLGQILNNFLSNAMKFTERGGVDVRVKLVGRAGGTEQLRFVVQDTGIGMSRQQLDRVFHPFVQAEPGTSGTFGGTGLGLVIARRLAELMGGTVEIASEPGRGTTLTLQVALEICEAAGPTGPPILPRREALACLVEGRRDAPSPQEAEAQGTLVLVVDDHPTNRQVLLRQLDSLGYAALAAVDGVEALALWSSRRFGAVVTDCNMPRMNGYQLATEIRGSEQRNGSARVPVIACTANALPAAVASCVEAGMDDCLVKPADLAKVSEMMDRWLPLAREGPAGQPAALAAPAAIAAEGLLDTALLAEISGGSAPAKAQILADFRRANELDATALRQSVGGEDFAPVMDLSHRMKGAALMLGAGLLSQACGRIEAAGAAGDREGLGVAMSSFEDELLRLNCYMDTLA